MENVWCYVVQTGVVHSAHQLKTLSLCICICICICNCICDCIYLFWKWKVWCYVVQTGVVHTGAHQLRPQPVSVASVEGRMASGLCATNLGPPGVWRQTLITVPPNLGIQSQLTPFLLWPGGSNWRNVRAGTTNKRRESKQEGGVEHQSHISLSETADHPSSSCEQKEKIDTNPRGQKSTLGMW